MNDNKYLTDAAKILTAQSREISALKRDIEVLNSKIAMLENRLVAVLRWHFSEGGSAPELITDEYKSTVLPSEIPFGMEERDGVTIIFARGAVLR